MTWTVGEVMTREVVTVSPSDSFKACADLLRLHAVSALPVVVAGERLVGIVSEADLMRAVAMPSGAALGRPTAADVMTRDVITTSSRATVAAAARLMSERGVKRLPVVDSENRVIGIVSRADILRIFLRSDESIRKEVAHGLLDEMPLLGRGRVQVSVKDGVVRLDGEVETGSLTGLLVRLIAGVPGVVGVENHLHLAAELSELEPAVKRAAGAGRG
jgi:CBS domain-containing protein